MKANNRLRGIPGLILCTLAPLANAGGGPPMLTDDPGTPGHRILEINVAATLESASHWQLWQLPVADLNYGVGERMQLNLSMSLNRNQEGAYGAGSTSAAIKWRFLESPKADGLSASIYPRVEWNTSSASLRHGLVDPGTRVFLPVELARPFGPLEVNLELGRRLSTADNDAWVYGLLGGVAAGPGTDLMAELHGESAHGPGRGQLTANLGLKQRLVGSTCLIASLGQDLRSAPDTARTFIAYLGLQALF